LIVEKRTKHRDNLANAKLIPSILPDYIMPLAGTVSRDSMIRYFEYSMIILYLPKGIFAVRVQQDNIAALKFITSTSEIAKTTSCSPHTNT